MSKIVLDASTLDIETRYRFAEIELVQGIRQLSKTFPYPATARRGAIKFIQDQLLIDSEEKQSAFADALTMPSFVYPRKDELIHYFRYQNAGYNKIVKLAGVSPNSISSRKYEIPQYYPIYRMWDEYTLSRWEAVKPALNLWDEKLIHSYDS